MERFFGLFRMESTQQINMVLVIVILTALSLWGMYTSGYSPWQLKIGQSQVLVFYGMQDAEAEEIPLRELSFTREALKSKWFGIHFVTWMHADIHQQAKCQTGAQHTGTTVTHQRQCHSRNWHQSNGHACIDNGL